MDREIIEQERPFLHQLSNLVAFIDGQATILLKRAQKSQQANQQLDIAELNTALDRIVRSCREVNETISLRRDFVVANTEE